MGDRTGKYWSPKEIITMIELLCPQGMSFRDVADRLRRSEKAIISRLNSMGFSGSKQARHHQKSGFVHPSELSVDEYENLVLGIEAVFGHKNTFSRDDAQQVRDDLDGFLNGDYVEDGYAEPKPGDVEHRNKNPSGQSPLMTDSDLVLLVVTLALTSLMTILNLLVLIYHLNLE